MTVDRDRGGGEERSTDDADEALVAVIGMAGRFPGAPDLDRFWQNLAAGVESLRHFTDEELLAAGESPAALREPGYVRACPFLDDIDMWDAAFFGFSPKDAAIADPQHRLFLEVAWEAFEHAGYDPVKAGVVGVWAACGLNSYLMHHLVTNPELMESVGEWLLRHTANDMNFLATRVSYELDLRGPSMNVQTACSSTLVTIHLAVQSLLGRECDVALAGGSTISLPQRGYLYKEGEIVSADGHCRPFDARSTGTLFGSGAGAVVLKRLADARRDRDAILAVVRGSAINNDGAQKVGYLAPSVDGQARAIAEALTVAGVDASTISYVEAHGTGTHIGDPIEVAALTSTFRAHTDRRGFCGLGSLKSNIGHLGEAAGVSGVIKTILALGHGQLPPSAGYERPNPQIDFASSPFYVVDSLRDWPRGPTPRRAGVTALGAGGTNAHVVLEEAPVQPPGGPARAWHVLPISARSGAALDAATARLVEHLGAHPELPLADAAYTLQVGRRAFEHRRVAVVRDAEDAISVLGGGEPRRLYAQRAPRENARVVFAFPGAGGQHAGMGRELYATEPVFRAAVDECLAHARAELGVDVAALLYPRGDAPAGGELERPSVALPALFATEYALARLLASWGIEPAALIGHSLGEYVAACVAGVMSPRDGMRLVAKRGALTETLPPGGMLAVPLAPDELARLEPGHGLSLAAVNAPDLCVASGPADAIAALEARLGARDLDVRRLRISMPAHSSMLDPILPEFERFCRTIALHPPKIPYVSNLTGAWITSREATDPQHWVRHLRQTVRFADGLAALLARVDGPTGPIFLELGPGRTLTSLAAMQPRRPAVALPTMPHATAADESDVASLLTAIGQLWLAGAPIDWARLHPPEAGRRRVPLPTYPFERQHHWIDRVPAATRTAPAPGALKRKADIADWFWLPSWTRTRTPAAAEAPRTTLIFDDGDAPDSLGAELAARLPGAVLVRAGAAFTRAADGTFTVAPGRREDYDRLLGALREREQSPDEIVHLWAVPDARGDADALARYDHAVERFFTSVLFVGQALGLEDRPARLTVVSSGLHPMAGDRAHDPLKALLLGPARVVGAELPAIASRSVDVQWPPAEAWQRRRAVDQLVAELAAPRAADPTQQERVIAYRGAERLVQSFTRAPLPAASAMGASARGFRDGGVYVITGGMGGIGFTLAEHLARTAGAKLVLVGRTPRPERERALAALGADVLFTAADVTDLGQMRAALRAARARFGAITGMIHAAGVLDDDLIMLKAPESAARVLAPKVKGALVLDALAREAASEGVAPPELTVLFSSVSAVLGLQGQVDYTAANAFLDALAAERADRAPETTLSIDWGAWRDVGMAATLAGRAEGRPPGAPTPADWLGTPAADGAFERVLGAGDWWVVSEHVVEHGDALIPGTGLVEIAREAAARALPGAGALVLEDVVFLAPVAFAAGERRRLRVVASTDGAISIESAPAGGGATVRHVSGRAARVTSAPPEPVDAAAVRARCSSRGEVGSGGFLPQHFMSFGPRWGNITAIQLGAGEALIDLALPEAFASDLDVHALHPALLDMATGGVQALIAGFDAQRDFYVPFSYGRVRVHAPLPRRVSSHVRLRPGEAPGLATFDAVLFDERGHVVVEIEGFVMKRVADTAALAPTRADAPASEGLATALREAAFREGMRPAEGLEALERIVAARLGPQVVATPLDLNEWITATTRANQPAAETSGRAPAPTAARPAVGTTFVAPRDEEEERIAALWRSMLGVEQVGVHDNFFELGGHSLLLTQTITRLRKVVGVDVPLSALLPKLTIAEMAAELARLKAAGQAAVQPAMKAAPRDAYRAKRVAVSDTKPPRGTPRSEDN